ncbi:MAG: HPr kinase/phosphatase C-terminal domain-containing protein [Sphingomonadales bacterium]|nr:HPr kinase/phosphatase C-terminal domain-containing protein [Sphingomonadales bacterium]
MNDRFAHQATAVGIGSRALLIEGAPGVGKSSLALALIDRGARLIGDDSILLERIGGHLHARPHPNTHGLLEIRNLGLIPFPASDGGPVALVLTLDRAAPRYIEAAETAMRAGIAVPHVRLWPDSPVLALRAEQALAHYGLP